MNLQLEFVDGITDDDLFAPETNHYESGAGSLVQAQSDPIHGSLGYQKKYTDDELTTAQQFEVKMRNMKKPVFVDDPEQVTDTLESIKIAEELTGGHLPKYEDREEMRKINQVRDDARYHLEDSDDETDEIKESKKSVKWAENELKRRWFINAGEKRSYEEKYGKGKIRPEVADFKDTTDADPLASAEELADKEAAKKARLIKEAEEKKEAEIDRLAEAKEGEIAAKMTSRQDKKKKGEWEDARQAAEDQEARESAQRALEAQEKADAEAKKAKEGDYESGNSGSEKQGDYESGDSGSEKKPADPSCPPELRMSGIC